MKKYKCKICGWNGKTHMHHIIPLTDYGEDIPENIIEICPNHHSDAQGNEKWFAEKYNLVGRRYSIQKIKDLTEASIIFSKILYYNIDTEQLNEFIRIVKKHKFNRIDFLSSLMGVTKKYIEQNYVKDKQNFIIKGRGVCVEV